MDGTLVLGGFDSAKITLQNYTGKLDASSCVTKVVLPLTDMTLVFPNGTSASLMSGTTGSTTNYCIDPQYPMITMNNDQWNNWMSAHPNSVFGERAGGGPNVWGLLYTPDVM